MSMVSSTPLQPLAMTEEPERKLHLERAKSSLADVKTRHCSKIQEFQYALVDAGYDNLESQAEVLRLPRSTAWSVFNASHKGSGLSAASITRMSASPKLPTTARAILLEYIEEKVSGVYGSNERQQRRFLQALGD
jgi:hypothetical protein